MQEIDNNIKQALKTNLQRIDDVNFTKNIVDSFLAKKQIAINKPVFDLSSFVIGLSMLIGSIGLVIVLMQNYDWMKIIDIKVEDGLLLVVISSVFLIYKMLDGIIEIKRVQFHQ